MLKLACRHYLRIRIFSSYNIETNLMENVCLEVFVIKDKVIYDVMSFRSVFFYKCEYLSGFNESAPKNFM